ncbi:MAG: MDR family oxidoreductase [Chloroflexota bacterium]
MAENRFRALLVDQIAGQTRVSFPELERNALPPGEVLIEVAFSSLNYKDGLAVTGRGQVVRQYPLVPGIDLAGTVLESDAGAFKPGDRVIATGWGLGETHWGGYAQLARVQAGWITPLPPPFTLAQAMAVGTAGFTAMLCILALEEHGLTPGEREVVVTGASGGVGSLAVAILAKLGYKVVASTGQTDAHAFFSRLGAQRLMDRRELAEPPRRPLAAGRWAAAVDVVGGDTLASLLAAMAPGASVAACGLAGGSQLNTTVFPFILRGVNLLGIDTPHCPPWRRQQVWSRLGRDLPLEVLDSLTQVIPLIRLPEFCHKIVDGQVCGRVLVDVNDWPGPY